MPKEKHSGIGVLFYLADDLEIVTYVAIGHEADDADVVPARRWDQVRRESPSSSRFRRLRFGRPGTLCALATFCGVAGTGRGNRT